MDTQQSVFAVYQAHLREGRLAYQYSPTAGKAVFYPRVVCPYTGETTLEWRVSQGRGTVYSNTVVHRRGEEPYNVTLIDMDEGFRLMSTVKDASGPVAIGAAVRLSGVGEDGDTLYPLFTLDTETPR